MSPVPYLMSMRTDQGRVDDIAVAHYPADIGCRPPDVIGLQPKDPLAHGVDVDLVSAMRVHG